MNEIRAIGQSEPLCFPSSSHGMALILCLLLMTILCLVGGAALGISVLNHQIVHNGTKQAQAFYMAETGRQMALAYIMEDPIWRGDEPVSGSFAGEISINDIKGTFNVSVSDCTADENGIYSESLPAGYALIKSTGGWMDATQKVSCLVRISPVEASVASFPQVAVVSAGSISGSLTALDDLGDEDSMLIKAPVVLPSANVSGLKAMAEKAFSSIDDGTWDAGLDGITSFWLDTPTDTRPRILYVEGDLEISGGRQVYGIVFVEGKHVSLDGESGIQGVLYAPNATDVTVYNTGASGRSVVTGMMVAGTGGVTVSGNPVSVQYSRDYIDAFNIAAGSEVDIDVAPGSWRMR